MAAPSFGEELLAVVLDAAARQGRRSPSEVPGHVTGAGPGTEELLHVRHLPARTATYDSWPAWAHSGLIAAYRSSGIDEPYRHQTATAEAAWRGAHVVVATGTASGKSLGYQLPILTHLADNPQAVALYISPTKALAVDQAGGLTRLCSEAGIASVFPATYDGDTPPDHRSLIRESSRWVLTNPDMIHHSMLAGHERWARVWRNLAYIVIDECHAYRGVFGSHVAILLRRMRRVAARYGAHPTVVCASATTREPGATVARLAGLDAVTEVTEDASPSGARTVALWMPALTDASGDHGAPLRRPAPVEASRMVAALAREGARTLAFVRSRRSAESVALGIRDELRGDPAVARVAAYRAGYLAEDRRRLERGLNDGSLLAVATTNALELGIDVSGVDAVVLAGFPGTVASFWQQAGRAGRRGQGALVALVCRDDPLDSYLAHHPEALLDRPVEPAVIDPTNSYLLGPHLRCACAEVPLTDGDDTFGPWEEVEPALLAAEARGLVRHRGNRWFPAGRWDSAWSDVDLRGGEGGDVAIVDSTDGRLLGTTDRGRACQHTHAGAVYLHQGECFVIDELDLDEGLALCHPEDPGWTTRAMEDIDVQVAGILDDVSLPGSVSVGYAEVEVTSRVRSYRRVASTGQILATMPLDLPEFSLPTRAVFYTLELARLERALRQAGLEAANVPGALHAAEHSAIGLLPLIASCDRGDIGGLSTAFHTDTGRPTVFVYDGHAGGAGFAERGYTRLREWLSATRHAVASCPCVSGCPSCIQSPKCGNGNHPLSKPGAVVVLDMVVEALTAAAAVSDEESPNLLGSWPQPTGH